MGWVEAGRASGKPKSLKEDQPHPFFDTARALELMCGPARASPHQSRMIASPCTHRWSFPPPQARAIKADNLAKHFNLSSDLSGVSPSSRGPRPASTPKSRSTVPVDSSSMTEGGTQDREAASNPTPPPVPPSPPPSEEAGGEAGSRASSSPSSPNREHDNAIRTVLHAGGFDKGAKVWVPKEGGIGWVRARLLAKEEGADGFTTFTLEELLLGDQGEDGGSSSTTTKPGQGKRRVLKTQRNPADGHFPDVHLCNESSELEGEGEAMGVSDLVRLVHLHEPAILHTVELRYWRDTIYTYTGPILIAVNPFKPLSIYGPEVLSLYQEAGERAAARLAGQGGDSEDETPLAPHVYAVADAAYRAMMGPLAAAHGERNSQSILISGESGSGKTESTKFIMNYLAAIASGKAASAQLDEASIASQVLQSNPILETFGNARTIRNDNSSRFGTVLAHAPAHPPPQLTHVLHHPTNPTGKFIELHFERGGGSLTGASIATYLLEKVRIVSQAEGDRNYHAFYQLVKGAGAEERAALGLEGPEAQQAFTYLSHGSALSRQDGVDDAEEFQRTKKAMDIMGFSAEEQSRVMKVVAAVLHLGNLRFALRDTIGSTEGGDHDGGNAFSPDAAQVSADSVATAERVASLLGVDAQAFQRSLTERSIQAGAEQILVRLSPAQADGARDALAKAIYGNLFLWIVDRVNAAIHLQHQEVESGAGSRSFVGLLDIFGFECFVHNSFEQLCINYTNEILQQQFNQFVFKLEQEEYQREEISWSFVSFPDNQECLDLLENRSAGIFALLDEQCVVPKATDQSYANRLYDTCKAHARFSVSPRDRVEFRFVVRHYAGDVTYDTAGFLEKNKDQLYQETVDLLGSSLCPVVRGLSGADASAATTVASPAAAGGPKRRSVAAPLTVVSQFKGQLALLLQRIRSTRPHYVRCLKPNDKNVAGAFDEARIIEQLRCGGVLEAVRVSRAGYPTRMVHPQFNQRYRPLALDAYHKARRKAAAQAPSASDADLDRRLAEAVIRELADILWRKRREEGLLPLPLEQERLNLDLTALLGHVGLQLGRTKVFFRLQAFEELETMRGRLLQVMTVKVQAFIRAWTRQRAYRRLKAATLAAQRLVRGFLARREALRLRQERAATRIQATVRGKQAQRRLRTKLSLILTLQCLWRQQQARRQLRHMRQFRAVVRIQAWARMRSCQRRAVRMQTSIVQMQTSVRGFLAKRELRRLRIEAKDMSKIVRERDELRAKVRELEAQLSLVAEERETLAAEKAKVAALEARVQALEAEAAQTTAAPAAGAADPEEVARLLQRIKELEALGTGGGGGGGSKSWSQELGNGVGSSSSSSTITSVPTPLEHLSAPKREASFYSAVSEQDSSTGETPAGWVLEPLVDEDEDEDGTDEEAVSPTQTTDEKTAAELAEKGMDVLPAATVVTAPSGGKEGAPVVAGATRKPSASLDTPAPAFLLLALAKSEETDAVVEELQARLAALGPKSKQQQEVVNAGDEHGRTALHEAALAGSARIVEVLLAHGANPTVCDTLGLDTPLHLSSNQAVTRALLAAGADPAIANRQRDLALHGAVLRGDSLSAQALLEKPRHRRCVNERNLNKDTALHLACKVGLLDAVALLCEHEAFKEAADKDGFRPLHVICSSHDQLPSGPGIVHFLLDAGADGGCRTAAGLTPLHMLCDNPAYTQYPTQVCEMADLLMDKGVSPDVEAQDGATPLHLAARNNFEELSALLIRRGASMTIPWRIPGGMVLDGSSVDEDTPSGGTTSRPRSRAASITSVEIFAERSPDQAARMIEAISAPQDQVPDDARGNCMECQGAFTLLNRRHHCRFCQRLLCQPCSSAQVPRAIFPKGFTNDPRAVLRTCHICFHVLTKRQQAHLQRQQALAASKKGNAKSCKLAPMLPEEKQCVSFEEVARVRKLQQQGGSGHDQDALVAAAAAAAAAAATASADAEADEELGDETPEAEGDGEEAAAAQAKRKRKRKKKKKKKMTVAVVEGGEDASGSGISSSTTAAHSDTALAAEGAAVPGEEGAATGETKKKKRKRKRRKKKKKKKTEQPGQEAADAATGKTEGGVVLTATA